MKMWLVLVRLAYLSFISSLSSASAAEFAIPSAEERLSELLQLPLDLVAQVRESGSQPRLALEAAGSGGSLAGEPYGIHVVLQSVHGENSAVCFPGFFGAAAAAAHGRLFFAEPDRRDQYASFKGDFAFAPALLPEHFAGLQMRFEDVLPAPHIDVDFRAILRQQRKRASSISYCPRNRAIRIARANGVRVDVWLARHKGSDFPLTDVVLWNKEGEGGVWYGNIRFDQAFPWTIEIAQPPQGDDGERPIEPADMTQQIFGDYLRASAPSKFVGRDDLICDAPFFARLPESSKASAAEQSAVEGAVLSLANATNDAERLAAIALLLQTVGADVVSRQPHPLNLDFPYPDYARRYTASTCKVRYGSAIAARTGALLMETMLCRDAAPVVRYACAQCVCTIGISWGGPEFVTMQTFARSEEAAEDGLGMTLVAAVRAHLRMVADEDVARLKDALREERWGVPADLWIASLCMVNALDECAEKVKPTVCAAHGSPKRERAIVLLLACCDVGQRLLLDWFRDNASLLPKELVLTALVCGCEPEDEQWPVVLEMAQTVALDDRSPTEQRILAARLAGRNKQPDAFREEFIRQQTGRGSTAMVGVLGPFLDGSGRAGEFLDFFQRQLASNDQATRLDAGEVFFNSTPKPVPKEGRARWTAVARMAVEDANVDLRRLAVVALWEQRPDWPTPRLLADGLIQTAAAEGDSEIGRLQFCMSAALAAEALGAVPSEIVPVNLNGHVSKAALAPEWVKVHRREILYKLQGLLAATSSPAIAK